MTHVGPTQGAERHEVALSQRWTSHPWIARILRVSIVLVPLLLSFAFTLAAGRYASADDLAMNRWIWIFVVFVLANMLLWALRSAANRLMPLVALMKLTLVFPDNAPSRTRTALRTSNSRTMLRNMEEDRARGAITGETVNGDYLVQLLKEVNDHDRLTRGHSERVRAYADLLGTEIGLSDSDMNKLRWAALLHDVGKLTVPPEILNKNGRPDDAEWEMLQNHPTAGIPLLEPLRGWLGDWIHAADQHHCRWDGKGYPSNLAGEEIALSGRLVAIADAYDVMTSTRSYKQPLSAEAARQELTNCAGTQFDPELVRAFLRIGLGRLTTIAGPFAWIANLGGSAQLPVPAANAIATAGSSAGAAAVAIAVVATSTVLGDSPTEDPTPEPELAAREVPVEAPAPVVSAQDQTLDTVVGSNLSITLEAEGPALSFGIGGAVHGVATLSDDTTLVSEVDGVERWTTTAFYTADADYVGQDAFAFEACDPDGRCDQGMVTIDLAPPEPTSSPPTVPVTSTTTTAPPATEPPATQPPATAPPATSTTPATTAPVQENRPPIVADDAQTTAEDATTTIDVLDNDRDPDGDALSISGVGDPLHGVAEIDGPSIRFRPDRDFVGTDRFAYTVTDGRTSVSGGVTVTVTPVNDAPTITVADASIAEGAPIGTFVTSSAVTDSDSIEFTYQLAGDPDGRFTIDADGVVRTAVALDHELLAGHDLVVQVSDGDAAATDDVRIDVVDVDEPPTVGADSASTDEDVAVDIPIRDNDADPEAGMLTWIVPTTSAEGGRLDHAGGVVSYVPPRDFSGTDSFRYTAEDASGNRSRPATVTIAVGRVNDPPVAADDSGAGFATDEDTAFTTAPLTANDTDVDERIDPASIVITSGPSAGSISLNDDGTVDYAPDSDVNGMDTFRYTISDADAATSAPATVTILVASVNDAPVANDDAVSVRLGRSATTSDLRVNDTDVDGDTLTVIAVSDGVSGTVVNNGDGTVTYTHAGGGEATDSFTYAVEDASGARGTASVDVTITPRPDHDGVEAGDNCPSDFNPAQFDTDGDGLGDVCDPSPTVVASGNLVLDQTLTSAESVDVASADFDGDGDLDVVFANDGEHNRIYVTNALDRLVPTSPNLGNEDTRGVAVADFDGDGNVDIVFANDGVGNRVWLNDGSADFTVTGQSIGANDSQDVVAGDVDADGDVDLVFANRDEPNTVWLNIGSGLFIDSGQALGSAATRGVSIGDLDGDDDLDLVFTNDVDDDTVWSNDGTGQFVDSGQVLGTGRSHSSVLADLDRDGDLDLAIAGDGDGDTVWLNDGTGVFTANGAVIGLGHSRAVDAGDLDGDGDLDLVFGDHTGPNSIWLNDGDASFSDSGNRLGDDETEGGILVDINSDGDLGYIAANADDRNRHYVNI